MKKINSNSRTFIIAKKDENTELSNLWKKVLDKKELIKKVGVNFKNITLYDCNTWNVQDQNKMLKYLKDNPSFILTNVLYQDEDDMILSNPNYSEKEYEEKYEDLKTNMIVLENKLKNMFDSIADLIRYTRMNPEAIAQLLGDYDDENSTQLYNKWVRSEGNRLSDMFFP